MAGLADFRQKYPQYDDVPDVDLADKLHAKFYSDIPKADYFQKLGLAAGPPAPSTYQRIEGGLRSMGEALGSGTPEQAGATLQRAKEGFQQGFGEQPIGIDPKTEETLPFLKHLPPRMKQAAAAIEIGLRAPGGIIGGAAGLMAGIAQEHGLSEAEANRLMRDFGILGQGALLEDTGHSTPEPSAIERFLGRAETLRPPTRGDQMRAGMDFATAGRGEELPALPSPDMPPGEPTPEPAPTPVQTGVNPQPAAAVVEPAPAESAKPAPNYTNSIQPAPPTRATLEDILKDPRSAEEIRADLEKQAKIAAEPPPPEPIPGTRDAPVTVLAPEDVHAGAETTAVPTPAQAEAGNYQKRHVQWQGHDIAIETEAGGVRTGMGGDGKPWSVTLPNPYGYIKRTKGADGDQVDITLGPQPQAPQVFVVDQIDPATGKFDEHKNFAGFPDEHQAVAAYHASFSDGSGPARMGAVSSMSVPEFTQWVKDGNTKKALAYKPAPVLKNVPAQPKGPQNLLQFLAAKGGLRLDQGGDLRALGIGPQTRIVVPGMGFRNLVRPTGLDLDKAREMALEAGYLHDPGWNTDKQATTTPDDLLSLIREGIAGRHTFTQEGHVDLAAREQKRQEEIARERTEETAGTIRDFVKERGLLASDEQIREAADLALRQGGDPTDAIDHVLERDALALWDEGAQIIESHREERPDAQVVTAGAAGEGQAVAANVDEPARPASPEAQAPPRVVEPDQTREPQPASPLPASAAGGERQPERPAVDNPQKDLADASGRSEPPAMGTPDLTAGGKGNYSRYPDQNYDRFGNRRAERPPDQPPPPTAAPPAETESSDQKAPSPGPSSFELPKSMNTAALIDLRGRIDQATSEDRGAVSRWLEDQFDDFAKEGARIAQACLEQGGGYSIR
jgi:hypothetical protein